MGSASLAAAERFHTNAEQLASLAVLQITIYALMQVPVGFLLDRFGARALLFFGAVAMAAGQVVVAFSLTLDQAILGRVLVGLGDAFTFISLIRVINGWYSGRRASQLQQWLGNLGQLGQVLSAVPFASFLALTDWQTAFLGVSSASMLAALLVLIAVKNERVATSEKPLALSFANIRKQFRANLSNPGTRFAFWVHFSTQSAATVFVLLWGFPFLERGEGLAKAVASALISSMVFVGIFTGLFYGWLCGSKPHLRYRLVVAVSLTIAAMWYLVLLWPGVAPIWLCVALVAVLGGAGPASMIAFDFSKTYTPIERLGSANGIVNIGGFFATLVTMYLVGVALDLAHASRSAHLALGSTAPDLYSLESFRIAMWIQVAVILLGCLGLRREYRLVKKLDLERVR
jgi:nitrate/nitrite transporter NarK